MAQDFWLTGIGMGAYDRSMLVYQQTQNGFHFNHAHNQYLQLVVEGGLLLSVPAAIALVAGWRQIVTRFHADLTPIVWIRIGAASGVFALVVQSLWDFTLRMPANAVLFALLAAIAMHDPE